MKNKLKTGTIIQVEEGQQFYVVKYLTNFIRCIDLQEEFDGLNKVAFIDINENLEILE